MNHLVELPDEDGLAHRRLDRDIRRAVQLLAHGKATRKSIRVEAFVLDDRRKNHKVFLLLFRRLLCLLNGATCALGCGGGRLSLLRRAAPPRTPAQRRRWLRSAARRTRGRRAPL